MTHEEKQKLAVIKSLFESWNTVDARTGAHGIAKNHYDNLAREILTALRELEPERLEVEIEKYEPEFEWHRLCWNVNLLKNSFNEEQEAIDFCKRYNLQIAKASK